MSTGSAYTSITDTWLLTADPLDPVLGSTISVSKNVVLAGGKAAVMATVLAVPTSGAYGISLRNNNEVIRLYLGSFSTSPPEDTLLQVPTENAPVSLALSYVSGEVAGFYSLNGVTWDALGTRAMVGAPTTAEIFIEQYVQAEQVSVTFGNFHMLPGALVIPPPIAAQTFLPIGTAPLSQPLPLTPTEMDVIHALVGAQFGDLEFDVGKSVRWTQWFVDDVFITDINYGTQRFWVIDWTQSFANANYKTAGINFFEDPVGFRKRQFSDAETYARNNPDALVFDNDDWVLWIDAHEGLSADNQPPYPPDSDFEVFRPYIAREIERAVNTGKDRIMLPFFVYVRHDNIQNVQYDSGQDGGPKVIQAMGVPYYIPYQGLLRLMKVSVLRDPSFDWSLLDTPVPLDVETTGGPAYLNPTVGTVSVPDPATLPNQFCWVWRAVGPTGADAFNTLAGQWRAAPASNRSWVLRIQPDGDVQLQYSDNGGNVATTGLGADIDTVPQTRAFTVNKITGDVGVLLLTDSGWVTESDFPGFDFPKNFFDSTLPVIIGQSAEGTETFNGRIYSFECRTGLNPAAGTVLWRFDASEYPGTGTSYVDPRGKTWTLTSASALAPATSGAKLQIVSYGYAHWNVPVVPPGELSVSPIDAENDLGWRQRNLLSQVRPIPGLPYGATWQPPSADNQGLAGPWAPDTFANDVTGVIIPEPRPPIAAAVDGVRVPLYHTVFRLNLRDGAWYAGDGTGNEPLVWDDGSQSWRPVPVEVT